MATHDAERRRQSESPPREFRGEERVEDLGLRLGVHAAAGILDFDKRIDAGGQFAWNVGRAEIGRDGLEDSGADADRALVAFQCVGRVEDQIHDHLANLRGVPLDRSRVQVQFDGGLLGRHGLE